MASTVSTVTPIAVSDAKRGRIGARALLLAITASALALAGVLGPGSVASNVDPDLARLLGFMALLKGLFAVIALGLTYWRLGRPAVAWREIVYVAGPGLMAGGALCLWQLQSAGVAALGLHMGMLALLASALTDRDFIPALHRRRASSPLPSSMARRETGAQEQNQRRIDEGVGPRLEGTLPRLTNPAA